MIKQILLVSAFLASTSAFAASNLEDLQIFSMNENSANEKPFVIAVYGAKAKAIYDNTMSDIVEEETKMEDKTLDWGGWSKTSGKLTCSKTYLKASPLQFEYLCDIDLGAFGNN